MSDLIEEAESKILIKGLTFGGVNYGDVVSYSEYKALVDKLKAADEVVEAATNLYDNRLGWSDGRNPYAHIEFWDGLDEALSQRIKEIDYE